MASYKKHPGLWFCLFAFESSFALGVMLARLGVNDQTARLVFMEWMAFIFYGLIYYHGKWVESRFRKESNSGIRRDKKNN